MSKLLRMCLWYALMSFCSIGHAQNTSDAIEDPIVPVILDADINTNINTNINTFLFTSNQLELSPTQQIEYNTKKYLATLQQSNKSTAEFEYNWYNNQVDLKQEIKCLAQNIYYEARGETVTGQLAVALVTINRLKLEEYPPTICKIVYQSKQFSWTRKHRKRYIPRDHNRWIEAMTIARQVLKGGQLNNIKDITEGSILYHNIHIHPKKMEEILC